MTVRLSQLKPLKRRITDKYGRTYSEDMQIVTGNAAASIAFRNAVLTVVPKAITKRIIDEVKQVALGQAIDLETSRQNCIAMFTKAGVNEKMLLVLRSTWNAIKEGTTTIQETFIQPSLDKAKEEESKEKKITAKSKAEEAIAKAQSLEV